MSDVVGLQQLRSFHLYGGTLEWAWCQLPHLTALKLGRSCSFIDYSFEPGTCRVKTLYMERCTSLLNYELEMPNELVPFLCCLPELEALTFTLCNSKIDQVTGNFNEVLKSGTLGSLETLLVYLYPLAPILKELTVQASRHGSMSFLEFVLPMGSSLSDFQNLSVLGVEHEMIVRSNGPTINQILPPGLERLIVLSPHLSVIPYLDGILPLQSYLSKLTGVELYPHNQRGDNYEEFCYRHHPTFDRLCAAGVAISIFWDPADHLEDWRDPNYDPFICEIIEFLAGLSLCRTPDQDMEACGML